MPTRVLLEGPAIEPLLAQVREEYGSGVRIISADKVRSGGFGGFFAKQHYELSVEVPDDNNDRTDMARTRAAAEPAPQTLEQLLEQAEAHDGGAGADDDSAVPGRLQGRSAGISDTEAAVTGRPPRSGLLSTTHNAFAELMAGLDNANAMAAGATPMTRKPAPPSNRAETKRPEGRRPEVKRADFARIDSGRADDGPAETGGKEDAGRRDDGDEAVKTDSGVVRPFRPSTATGSPVNGTGALKPLPPVPSLAELMGGLGLGDVDALATPSRATDDGDDTDIERTAIVRPKRSAAAAYGVPAPGATPDAAGSEHTVTEAPPAAHRARPVHASAPATPAPAVRTLAPEPSDPVVANLMRVGMPAELAASINGGDTYAGVLTALASRPAAPAVPDGPGEILVLVGELNHALASARECLEQIGLDQAHLLLAGPSAAGTGIHSSKVIPGPEDASRRTEKLHTADSAWVVAMDAPLGATDSAWVRETCEAIGATAVWAVVDATRKTADTARHLKLLGEIEALVVYGVDNTADPATVLGLEPPIVSLDGRPATPHAWAAMLCARIATDVVPVPPVIRRPTRSR